MVLLNFEAMFFSWPRSVIRKYVAELLILLQHFFP